MVYREYGRTGKKVSALGFGAMRLPFDDADASVELLRHGIAAGINYIDTAYGYGGEGRSEIYVGRAVAGQRDKVYVATKNPLWGDETVDGWWKRLETSLERMQTDYIDFYKVVHSLDWNVYTKTYEPLIHKEALKAKEQGMIRHICFSVHDTPENIIKLCETGLFEGMLLQYNLLDRANEDAIARAHELGMGVEVMGPVGGGRLGMASERLESLVPGVSKVPELALRFVLANPNVTCAMSGMSETAHVDENVVTASNEQPLTDSELQGIQEALEQNKELAHLYCTGCGYCMPCPQGVGIPSRSRP